jgi:hypothetical protein
MVANAFSDEYIFFSKFLKSQVFYKDSLEKAPGWSAQCQLLEG